MYKKSEQARSVLLMFGVLSATFWSLALSRWLMAYNLGSFHAIFKLLSPDEFCRLKLFVLCSNGLYAVDLSFTLTDIPNAQFHPFIYSSNGKWKNTRLIVKVLDALEKGWLSGSNNLGRLRTVQVLSQKPGESLEVWSLVAYCFVRLNQ